MVEMQSLRRRAILCVLAALALSCKRDPNRPTLHYSCSSGDAGCECVHMPSREIEGSCGDYPCCYGWLHTDWTHRAESGCRCTALDPKSGACPQGRLGERRQPSCP